ncbi:hypothetical protein Hanom_Chr11g00994131 [Helianthus anomalus]
MTLKEELKRSLSQSNIELPPEVPEVAEVNTETVSTDYPVISAENLALLLKKVTDTIGNPPTNLSVSTEELEETPRDSDDIPLKRKRRDPRPGMYIERSKDQSVKC